MVFAQAGNLGDVLANLAAVLTVAALVAFGIEWLLENTFMALLERVGLKRYNRVVAFVLLFASSLGAGLDLLTPLLTYAGIVPAFAQFGAVFTAAIVGGGSELIHLWKDRVR